MPTFHSSDFRAILWPRRLLHVRRNLNRASLVIVLLGLISLASNAFWVWSDRRMFADALDITRLENWSHPAYLNSVIIAIIILYAMRQISKTRLKLASLGYPLLHREEASRSGEFWKSVEPLTKRAARLHIIHPQTGDDPATWRHVSHAWIRRAEKAKRLTSPHSARMLDCGLADKGSFFAVTEMPRGVHVRDLVRIFGPCPLDRAMFLLAQVAHALQDAHDHQLFDVALRPHRVWVGFRGTNHDWITVELSGYDQHDEQEEGPAEDIRQLGRLAVLLLTGYWREDGIAGPGDAPDMMEQLRHHDVPHAIQLILMRCLVADPRDALPPVRELTRRMWAAMPADRPWNQDRAAAWWQQHQQEVTAGP